MTKRHATIINPLYITSNYTRENELNRPHVVMLKSAMLVTVATEMSTWTGYCTALGKRRHKFIALWEEVHRASGTTISVK